MDEQRRLLRTIRLWLGIFIVGLALSGITAFPLVHELNYLARLTAHPTIQQNFLALTAWVLRVRNALNITGEQYPFLAYGTDWLAFAHLVIAIAFIGPWRDPVRNKWVLQFGLIACASVPLLAFIAGPIRGIPLYWCLIDSCFGLFGCIPLFIALRATNRLEAR